VLDRRRPSEIPRDGGDDRFRSEVFLSLRPTFMYLAGDTRLVREELRPVFGGLRIAGLPAAHYEAGGTGMTLSEPSSLRRGQPNSRRGTSDYRHEWHEPNVAGPPDINPTRRERDRCRCRARHRRATQCGPATMTQAGSKRVEHGQRLQLLLHEFGKPRKSGRPLPLSHAGLWRHSLTSAGSSGEFYVSRSHQTAAQSFRGQSD